MTNADALAKVLFEEFDEKFGWVPDDLDLAVAEYLAKAVCERIGVDVPSLTYPAPYADFAAALGVAGGVAPVANTEGLPQVCSEGGPILAAPLELAAKWGGATGNAPTDYDRSCEHSDDYRATEYGGVDWVTVGDGRALVLDLELMTTAVMRNDGALIVRNWSDPPTNDDVDGWLERIADGAWKSFPGALVLDDGRLVVFDAAVPGNANPANIESAEGVATLALEPGAYDVDIAVHEGLDFIRLTPRRRSR